MSHIPHIQAKTTGPTPISGTVPDTEKRQYPESSLLNTAKQYLPILLYTLGVSILYWATVYGAPLYGMDDANIYFVYMRNLAEGHGFVYQTGGETVEGFTSLLWTLIGSTAYLLNKQITWVLFGLNCICISFALFQLLRLRMRLMNTEQFWNPGTILLLGILAAIPGFFEWTILSLMETGLWSTELILVVVALCQYPFHRNHKRTNRTLAWLLPMLILTRPESLLWVLIFLGIRMLQSIRIPFSIAALKGILLPIATSVCTLAGLTAWRLMYFGYPLPNTYYAKVSADRIQNLIDGLTYFIHFAIDVNPFAAIAVGAAFIYTIYLTLDTRKHLLNPSFLAYNTVTQVQLILGFCILVCLGIPFLTGGDHFGLSRFYQPLLPVFYVFIFNLEFWEKRSGTPFMFPLSSRWQYGAALILIVLISTSPKIRLLDLNESSVRTTVDKEFAIAELGRKVGKESNLIFADAHRLPEVGVITAGAFAFAYEGKSVDLMGLNDTRMAHANPIKTGKKNHAAFDKATFYELAPDIVGSFFGGQMIEQEDVAGFELEENRPEFRDRSISNRYYKGLYQEDLFQAQYAPVILQNRSHPELYYHAYFRNEYLAELDTNLFHITRMFRNP